MYKLIVVVKNSVQITDFNTQANAEAAKAAIAGAFNDNGTTAAIFVLPQ